MLLRLILTGFVLLGGMVGAWMISAPRPAFPHDDDAVLNAPAICCAAATYSTQVTVPPAMSRRVNRTGCVSVVAWHWPRRWAFSTFPTYRQIRSMASVPGARLISPMR